MHIGSGFCGWWLGYCDECKLSAFGLPRETHHRLTIAISFATGHNSLCNRRTLLSLPDWSRDQEQHDVMTELLS
jgi:hypothetical protein